MIHNAHTEKNLLFRLSVKLAEQIGISTSGKICIPSSGKQNGVSPSGKQMFMDTSMTKPAPLPILSIE